MSETKEREYNVYIDESGDEGIKRGSKFFILTAILVEKNKDNGISTNERCYFGGNKTGWFGV